MAKLLEQLAESIQFTTDIAWKISWKARMVKLIVANG